MYVLYFELLLTGASENIHSLMFSLDDPEKYAGAPISLQLVGRRYEDEKVRYVLQVPYRRRIGHVLTTSNTSKVIGALEFIKDKIGLPFATFV